MDNKKEIFAIQYAIDFIKEKREEVLSLACYNSACIMLLNGVLLDLKIKLKRIEGGD